MEKEKLNLNKFKKMDNYIGKKNGFFTEPSPIYDSESLISSILTFFTGTSKKVYDGSIMELLGKNAIDIFENYQTWKKYDNYYIFNGGFDGISFSWDNDFTINEIWYGRVLEGNDLIKKAKDFARINKFGLKIERHGNMRGVYYSVKLIDKYIETPYIGIESSSTFRNGEPNRNLIFV